MKHTALLSSASITLIVTIIIATGGCKKDEVNGPVSPSGNATGDLGGSYPAPSVVKLQGNLVSAIAPTNGQALVWNGTTTQWEPTAVSGLTGWNISGNNIYASNTGNVGLGTTTPNDELHIKKDVNSFVGVTIENATAGSNSTERISFVDENGNLAYIQCTDAASVSGPAMTIAFNRPNGFIAMNTAGTSRLVINNAGNVGIGTTIPSQKLTVSGNICATGSIGACSDIRYKKDITPMTDALSKILSLHGIYYNWDKKKIGKEAYTPERQVGFSAQEIEQYFPEIVQTDAKGYKAVDYSRLTPMLVEAMKEQQQVIERQRVQMDEQQNGLQQLRNEMEELKTLIRKQGR